MTRIGTDYRRQTGPRKEGEGRRKRRRGWHWEKIARRPIHEHCRSTLTEGRRTGGKETAKKREEERPSPTRIDRSPKKGTFHSTLHRGKKKGEETGSGGTTTKAVLPKKPLPTTGRKRKRDYERERRKQQIIINVLSLDPSTLFFLFVATGKYKDFSGRWKRGN